MGGRRGLGSGSMRACLLDVIERNILHEGFQVVISMGGKVKGYTNGKAEDGRGRYNDYTQTLGLVTTGAMGM